MIRLKTLELTNFRSVDSAVVQFPETGMVCIQGHNRDTGGSSGAGKTTIGLGVAYALGYCHLPGTTLKSWRHPDDPMTVKLELLTPAGTVVVTRGARLELSIDGQAVKGSAANKEQELAKILGTTPEVIKALTYRAQKTPSLFLSMTDSQKKQFLSDLLGLDRFEQVVERARIEAGELEGKAQALDHTVKALASLMPEPPKAPEGRVIDGTVLDVLRRDLALLESERAVLAEKHKVAKAVLSGAFTDIDDAIASVRQETWQPPVNDRNFEVEIQPVKKQRAEVDRIIAAKNDVVAQLKSLQARAANVQQAIEKAEAQTCPTCLQTWTTVDLKRFYDERDEIVRQVQECFAAKQEVSTLQAQRLELVAQIEDLERQHWSQQEAERVAKTAWQTEQNFRLAGLKAKREARNYVLHAQQAELNGEIEMSASRVDSQKVAIRNEMSRQASIDELNRRDLAAYEQACRQYEGLEAERAKLKVVEQQSGTLKDFVSMVGRTGFLGAIFDEVLAEISTETNDRLLNLPNVQSVTIWFKSEFTTGQGSQKKEIRPVVTLNGTEVPLTGLSGGMQTAVELAVDRAVAAVVARRTGLSFGWLFLDEAFDGFDNVVKENALEILKQISSDSLVMVVDHTTEFKELFSQTVTVEYAGGVSKVI